MENTCRQGKAGVSMSRVAVGRSLDQWMYSVATMNLS